MAHLLGALVWDPQIRGFVIVLTAFMILVGSVYLLLATNTGAKLGFLLAAAGFTGWCALMGWVWVIYGIGIKGQEPHWDVKEIVTGDVRSQSAVDKTESFPKGWEKLEVGDPLLGDAVATADRVLVPQTGAAGHGGEEAASAFKPVFQKPSDYTLVAGYRAGGEDYFVPGGYIKRESGFFQGWLHSPHYAVVQVQPVIPPPEIGGAPPEPVADPAQPVTNVVMVRNLGSLRVPSARFAMANTLAFAVLCLTLHRRDRAVMAARAATTG